MKTIALVTLVASAATLLLASGCSKTGTVAAPAMSEVAPVQSQAPAASSADASLPAAASVITPATASKADPAAGRTNSVMSRDQETSAMPLPGQNNDHSAPLTPAKRASAPR